MSTAVNSAPRRPHRDHSGCWLICGTMFPHHLSSSLLRCHFAGDRDRLRGLDIAPV